MRKRLLWIAASLLLALVSLAGAGVGVVYYQWRASLPAATGEFAAPGLEHPARIERDHLGIPVLRGKSRRDLAFAMGFAHAQDRFFQMDMLRRNSAGELSEVVGRPTEERDRSVRVHQFRSRAREVMNRATDEERAELAAYADGVNAGLGSLGRHPFEYDALGVKPTPWKPEDSVLVLYSMFLDLQGNDFLDESALGLIFDLYPEPMARFLAPEGSEWDSAIDGSKTEATPIPSSDVFDLRQEPPRRAWPPHEPGAFEDFEAISLGSNNWAVAGSRTTHGGAIVADDMHLRIGVPNIWYRAAFAIESEGNDPSAKGRLIAGVTLPGTPTVVVGSNQRIAWAFTNSEGDWSDLVIVEVDPEDNNLYRTADGKKPFIKHTEVIKIKGAADEKIEIRSTIWGPIIDEDHKGRPRALVWAAHDPRAANFGLGHMDEVATIEQAINLANRSGSPHQNFVVADDHGRIAWTILGRIPRRVGYVGDIPRSWSNGASRWDGYLDPKDYPRVIDPPEGLIWTANARVVGGEMLRKIGVGGFDLGARAGQIHNDLSALPKASELDMLAIQLDDRVPFWSRWQKLCLDVLTSEAVNGKPRRKEFRTLIENWGERASVDSAGTALVFAFRDRVARLTLQPLTERAKQADKRFQLSALKRSEATLWPLVSKRPTHLLPTDFKTWDDLLLTAVDDVCGAAVRQRGSLREYTWGKLNTTKIRHPMSQVVPWLSSWLDMPAEPLSGGWRHLPKIQRPNSGASERMAVSPGKEEKGYMHMPTGQSGHPLSPHYRDMHASWTKGQPTPFLPGSAVNVVTLKPAPKVNKPLLKELPPREKDKDKSSEE